MKHGTRAIEIPCVKCGALVDVRCGERFCRERILAAMRLTREANVKRRRERD